MEVALEEVEPGCRVGPAGDELVGRRSVGRPGDLERNRSIPRTADEGAGGVVDVEAVRSRVVGPHVEIGVLLAGAELAPCDAADFRHVGVAEQIQREVDSVDAEIDERAPPAIRRRVNHDPAPNPPPPNVVRFDVGNVTEFASLDAVFTIRTVLANRLLNPTIAYPSTRRRRPRSVLRFRSSGPAVSRAGRANPARGRRPRTPRGICSAS